MGALGFDDFKTYLKFQFGNNEDLEVYGDASINMYGVWFNLAYHDITERHKFWNIKKRFYFPELEASTTDTTADGTAYIDVPSDCLFVEHVYDTTNDRHLHWIPWNKYVAYTDRTDTSKEGEPHEWHRRGSYIYLYRTPDTDSETMTIYYRKRVSDLTGTSATLIGDEWDEPILLLANIKGNMWMRDWGQVEKLKDEFEDMVKDRMEIYTPEELSRQGNFRLHPAYTING